MLLTIGVINLHSSYAGSTRVSIDLRKQPFQMMDCRVKPGNDEESKESLPQFVQAKATLSSDFGPNRSEERATMRPPRAR